MEVKTFTEEGILKSCQECGTTVLVKSGTTSCPLCGSTNLEVDDTFASDGSCTRTDLANDWFYDSDIMPQEVRKNQSMKINNTSIERRVDTPSQHTSTGDGGLLIQMYPRANR